VEIKGQVDATDWFFIAKLTVCSTCFGAPLCPSSGAPELYRWLFDWLRPVEQYPANRTHNPELHTRPTTCKPNSHVPQARNICITLELLMMGIMVPRNMLSKQ